MNCLLNINIVDGMISSQEMEPVPELRSDHTSTSILLVKDTELFTSTRH